MARPPFSGIQPVRWSQKKSGDFPGRGRIDESGGDNSDGANPGVELEKEAEQGGARRAVAAAGRSARREVE